MHSWRMSTGLDMLPSSQCKCKFDHPHNLLTHHKERVKQGALVTGNTKIGRNTGVPGNVCASAAGRGVNSNTEDTHADLGRLSHPPTWRVTQGRDTNEHEAAPILHAGGQGEPGTPYCVFGVKK